MGCRFKSTATEGEGERLILPGVLLVEPSQDSLDQGKREAEPEGTFHILKLDMKSVRNLLTNSTTAQKFLSLPEVTTVAFSSLLRELGAQATSPKCQPVAWVSSLGTQTKLRSLSHPGGS